MAFVTHIQEFPCLPPPPTWVNRGIAALPASNCRGGGWVRSSWSANAGACSCCSVLERAGSAAASWSPPPHLQLTLHWKAEADLKTHMHNRLTICWELEAVGAVGQAEGLRVLSPVSTCMRARAHMHTLMCIHIHAHTHTFICKT